jgi:quinol monooxygenase YgiN
LIDSVRKVSTDRRLALFHHGFTQKEDPMNTNAASLAVVAIFRARAGNDEELGRQLRSLMLPTHREEGSRLYQICQSRHDSAEWIVLETWRDRAAFEFHMSTPYVTAFMRQVPRLCENDPQIRFLDIHPPTNAAEAA